MQTRLTYPLPGKNFVRVDIGHLTLWWSYSDLVAYKPPDTDVTFILDHHALTMTSRRHLRSLTKTRKMDQDLFTSTIQRNLRRWATHG